MVHVHVVLCWCRVWMVLSREMIRDWRRGFQSFWMQRRSSLPGKSALLSRLICSSTMSCMCTLIPCTILIYTCLYCMCSFSYACACTCTCVHVNVQVCKCTSTGYTHFCTNVTQRKTDVNLHTETKRKLHVHVRTEVTTGCTMYCNVHVYMYYIYMS